MHAIAPSPKSRAPFDSKPIRDLFEGMRTEHGKLSEYIEQTFDELDTLRTLLDKNQRDLENQHAEVVRDRQELDEANRSEAEQLVSLTSELDAARAELEQLRLQYSEERTANEAARQEIGDLCGQRDALREELESERARVVELEQTAEEAAQIGAALEEARDQRDHCERELHQARTGLDQSSREVASQRDQIAEQRDQIAAFKHERDGLEKELETVRARACKLSESMDQTKRQMAEEREHWSVELNKAQRLLERQIEQNASSRVAAVSEIAEVRKKVDVVGAGRETLAPDTTVVDSVMAQFDNIRRQRAQRHKPRHEDAT